jgi:uncharacterized protein YaiL (DUF2058 family)
VPPRARRRALVPLAESHQWVDDESQTWGAAVTCPRRCCRLHVLLERLAGAGLASRAGEVRVFRCSRRHSNMPAQLGKPLKGAATEQAGGGQGRRRAGGASAADQAERARLEAQAKADLARRLAAATRKQMKDKLEREREMTRINKAKVRVCARARLCSRLIQWRCLRR